METLLVILLAIALFGNWLWFVFFTSYRKEVGRQIRKQGAQKYLDIAAERLVARLDEAQRVGHLKQDKHTQPLYHFNDDGSTVMLLDDRIQNLKDEIAKGDAGVELDHVQPISKTVNFTNGDLKK